MALTALEPRQRNLLRQSYLDRVSIDQLAVVHRVHRSTVARWIQAARQLLLQNTRRELMERLQIDSAECDSLIRLIESRLEVSLRSIPS